MFSTEALAGKRVVLTGGSSGIGRDTAVFLSSLGAKLLIVGRSPERLARTLAELQGSGHSLLQCDLALESDFRRIFRAQAQDGKFSALVHCAGVDSVSPLRSMDLKKWDDVIRINVTAAMLLSQAFVSEHVSLTASSIVFVGSVMSLVGQPAKSSYCASKAALVGLTKSLALELAKEKKRVNLICPGMVETELLQEFRTLVGPEKMEAFEKLHPLGFGSTRDVSHAVAYLISDASRWITGTSLVVDGGFTAA